MSQFKQKTLAQEFDDYKEAVIPSDACDIQFRECEIAFYSGCAVMVAKVNEIIKNDLPKSAFSELVQEIDDFVSSIN